MYFYSTVILAYGPSIQINNWAFIIISIIITPIAFYIEHHFVDEDPNTVL